MTRHFAIPLVILAIVSMATSVFAVDRPKTGFYFDASIGAGYASIGYAGTVQTRTGVRHDATVGKGPLFTLQVTPLYALSNGLALGLESRFGILPTVTGAYALDGTVEGGALLSLSTVAAFRPVKNIEAKTGIGLEADLLVVSSGDVGHPWIGDVQTCSLLGPRAGASIGFVATGGFGLSLAGSASIRGECRILTLGVEGTYSTW